MNRCKNCAGKDLLPKCLVDRCNEQVVERGNHLTRYCPYHLDGENYDMKRKTFNTEQNDPNKGWRQEVPEGYGIVRDKFPVERS